MYHDMKETCCVGATTAGSLANWLYRTMRIPGFDLEALQDKEAFNHIRDTTGRDVLNLYRERHYNGLLSLLKEL